MTVGEKIKALRKEKGLTQKQLGELLGVTAAAVSQFENKQYASEFRTDTIRKLAEVLDVTEEEIATPMIIRIKRPIEAESKLISSIYESFCNTVDAFELFLVQKDIKVEETEINGQLWHEITIDRSDHTEVLAITPDQFDLLPDMAAEIVAGIIRAWSYKNSDSKEE